MLGIEDRVGSLEPGKDADIVIWSGDPFDFYSSVEQVFIDGKNIPLKK
jgi:imidazolonepropionase-like amidohydrolase